MTYVFNKLFAKKFPRKLTASPLHASFKHHGSLFIHIPKAAGSSISLTLYGHQVGHKKVSDYYFSDPKKTESLFKFSFVRNPLTRFESSFNFLKGNSPFLSDRKIQGVMARFEDVNNFCEAFLRNPDDFKSLHFIPQYRFINYTGNKKDKQIGIDFIGRFEKINADFNYICQKIGVDRTLSKVNTSQNSKVQHLSTANAERLSEFYDTDFYLFGYNL